MSMSLTISQPAKTEFGSGKFTHDFSPRISLAKSRVSPQPPRVDSPLSSLRVGASADSSNANMTTPHRGLPPPSAMTLPDPGRPPPHLGQSLGPMPAPPNQWQDQEESMRNWLAAKMEEDKRRQEEEKTRQESFKLDQRRIEQSMLREALQGGVPPSMVPMIYAGIGGANLANFSLEWLQQYAAQLHAAQQHVQQQGPPDIRMGEPPRLIAQQSSSQFSTPQSQHQVVPSQPVEQSQQPGAPHTGYSTYQSPPSSRLPPTSAPRSATHTQLPRLTTNEMYVHQPTQQGPGSAHPLQQSQSIQDQPSSSPSIYFHHWVPPNESKSNQPQTPASKGEPHSAIPGSHLSDDHKDSPRKRKAQGPHQAAPAPSERPQYTSPPFSAASSASGRKVSHFRSRSGTDSRPQSRREPDMPRLLQHDSTELSEDQQPRGSSGSLPQEESTGHSSTGERRPGSRGSQ